MGHENSLFGMAGINTLVHVCVLVQIQPQTAQGVQASCTFTSEV